MVDPNSLTTVDYSPNIILSNTADVVNNGIGFLTINHDPTTLFSHSFKIKCAGIVDEVFSEEISVDMTCDTNIAIRKPADLVENQSRVATIDVSAWNNFTFNSFLTDSTAC